MNSNHTLHTFRNLCVYQPIKLICIPSMGHFTSQCYILRVECTFLGVCFALVMVLRVTFFKQWGKDHLGSRSKTTL